MTSTGAIYPNNCDCPHPILDHNEHGCQALDFGGYVCPCEQPRWTSRPAAQWGPYAYLDSDNWYI